MGLTTPRAREMRRRLRDPPAGDPRYLSCKTNDFGRARTETPINTSREHGRACEKVENDFLTLANVSENASAHWISVEFLPDISLSLGRARGCAGLPEGLSLREGPAGKPVRGGSDG